MKAKAAANQFTFKRKKRSENHQHPPDVKEEAAKCLAILLERHKVKLANHPKRNGYYGVLVACSIRMALGRLGYIDEKEVKRKGGFRKHIMSSIRARLGNPNPSPDPTPCRVSSTNLDGI